jgi:hypothetical protein
MYASSIVHQTQRPVAVAAQVLNGDPLDSAVLEPWNDQCTVSRRPRG